jgi:hypothetical protein
MSSVRQLLAVSHYLTAACVGQHITARSCLLHRVVLLAAGHVPSAGLQEVLLTAALQQQQQQRMTSAELSCFVYCLASWGSSSTVTQQQLQQLEQQMVSGLQQQQQQQQCNVAAAAAAGVATPATSSSWDGPAVCSCCWSLVKLGCQLQPETLRAAEQHLQQLMPAAAATSDTSSSSSQGGMQQRLAPPSAQDLAMFGAACRQCSYQPLQLMSQFRAWLLLQLAWQGSSALLKLGTRTSASNRAAAAAARHSAAAAARAAARYSSSNVQPQAVAANTPAAATPHANVLVCVLMLLRQVDYTDRDLLQQLELAASHYPTAQQLTGQQLVMCVSSFRRLGHFPAAWWSSGLRALLDKHAAQLSARDCVELLEVLAAWRHMPGVGSSTRMRQRVFPRLEQRLLGQVWTPKQPRSSSSSSSRVGSAGGSSSSTDSSPVGSPMSSPSSSDSEQDPVSPDATASAATAAAAALDGSEAVESDKPAAALLQRKSAATAATGTSLIAELSGPQVVWLLHSIGQLGLNNQQLKKQAFRRLQVVWPQLQLNDQVAAAAAAGRLGFDATAMMNVAELTQQQQQQQQGGVSRGEAVEQGVPNGAFRSVSAAARTLWMFGNLGKHPGPALVDAALSHIAAAAAAAVSSDNQQQQRTGILPLREMTTALYAAAVLHELSHPAALALLQQLQEAAAAGQLLRHPQFAQQAPQLAACLLISQLAAPPPNPAATSAAAAAAAENPSGLTTNPSANTQATNPWLGFSREVQQRLLESWRRKMLLRSQSKPHALQQELSLALKQLGLRCRANAVTPDGCVCIDIAATSPQGGWCARTFEILIIQSVAVTKLHTYKLQQTQQAAAATTPAHRT